MTSDDGYAASAGSIAIMQRVESDVVEESIRRLLGETGKQGKGASVSFRQLRRSVKK